MWIALTGAMAGLLFVGSATYVATCLLMAVFDLTLNGSRDAGGIVRRALGSRASWIVASVAAFFGAVGGAVVWTFKR
jgi:hypothetical protein